MRSEAGNCEPASPKEIKLPEFIVSFVNKGSCDCCFLLYAEYNQFI